MKSLRERVRKLRGERKKILVDVDAPEADEEILSGLRDAGMTVERVLGNKVLGEIDTRLIPTLRSVGHVRAVEESAQLKPHGRP